jgi:hypothetical protein
MTPEHPTRLWQIRGNDTYTAAASVDPTYFNKVTTWSIYRLSYRSALGSWE